MERFDHVAVIGAGAFGTALGLAATRAGRRVTLLARDAAKAEAMQASRHNPRLAEAGLTPRISVSADLELASRADALILATPTQALGAVCEALSFLAVGAKPVIVAA